MIELLDDDYEFVVEEFSSYQASDLTASPQIAMFTNLFYVHTDWHRGHENYCRDKIHLIANQKPGDVYFANPAAIRSWSNIRAPMPKTAAGTMRRKFFMPKRAFCTGERKNWRISGN